MSNVEFSRELLSDRIYDLIRASILDGTRKPGARVIESEIARNLNVSQAPVREAVKRLVHAGLLTSEPRRGSYVTEISQAEIAIARQLRAGLEGVGARFAVESVTEVDVADLRAIVARMGVVVETGDFSQFRTLDMQFHSRVMLIGDHAVLARVWDALEPLLISQRAIGVPSFPGDEAELVRWHLDLIAALESGDAEAASAAFTAHAFGALSNES